MPSRTREWRVEVAISSRFPDPADRSILQYMSVLALQLGFAAAGAELTSDFAEQAAAFSLLLHFSQAAPEIILGAWAFLAEGLTRGEVEMGREAATG